MAPDDPPDPTRRDVLGAAAITAAALVGGEPVAGVAAIPSDLAPNPWPNARAGIDFICGSCGGNSVTRDACAEWDAGLQQWVLGAAFDYAFCHACEEETTLEEVPAVDE